jgi:hypothetical protein
MVDITRYAHQPASALLFVLRAQRHIYSPVFCATRQGFRISFAYNSSSVSGAAAGKRSFAPQTLMIQRNHTAVGRQRRPLRKLYVQSQQRLKVNDPEPRRPAHYTVQNHYTTTTSNTLRKQNVQFRDPFTTRRTKLNPPPLPTLHGTLCRPAPASCPPLTH